MFLPPLSLPNSRPPISLQPQLFPPAYFFADPAALVAATTDSAAVLAVAADHTAILVATATAVFAATTTYLASAAAKAFVVSSTIIDSKGFPAKEQFFCCSGDTIRGTAAPIE